MTRPRNLYEADATVRFSREGDEYAIAIRGVIDGQEAAVTRRFGEMPDVGEFAAMVECFLRSRTHAE